MHISSSSPPGSGGPHRDCQLRLVKRECLLTNLPYISFYKACRGLQASCSVHGTISCCLCSAVLQQLQLCIWLAALACLGVNSHLSFSCISDQIEAEQQEWPSWGVCVQRFQAADFPQTRPVSVRRGREKQFLQAPCLYPFVN